MTRKEYNNGVKLWADEVYRFAVHCCGDSECAKDCVQEAFASLWEHRDSVAETKGKGFLLTCVHHWAMSLHRHRKVHEENRLDMAGASTTGPDMRFDLREALQQAAARLPEIQRSALLLKDLEGYSCHEIAEILHVDEKQVSVYLYRARVSMRKTLIALGYDNNN